MSDDLKKRNEINPVVGIDLGTTYSCIARWADDRPEVYRLKDGSHTIPSIVFIQESGEPLVGKFARQYLMIEPDNSIERVKRYMGEDDKSFPLRGKDYSAVDISAMILQRLSDDVQRMFPDSAGFEIAGAVVTHPQYFKFPQIKRTQDAAEAAGLPVIRLLAEPIAAAIDYGFSKYQGLNDNLSEKILVFDLGGGTFDVTILHVINDLNTLTFKVMSVGGDDMLGGTNFDDALMDWALKEQSINLDDPGLDPTAKARSKATVLTSVIEAKEQLTALEDTSILAANILPGQHLDLDVTRAQFNQIIDEHCRRIRGIVSQTISTAGLREGELDRIIMIGGSSRIPIMKQIVEDESGAEAWANTDEDLAVCRGAAFLAAMSDGRVESSKEIIIEEVTAHSLGVRAAGNRYSPLILANRAAPVQATQLFTATSDSFDVVVFQGQGKRGDQITEDKFTELKPIHVSGVELGADGTADVKVTFKVNEQQLLFVKIEAPGVIEERQLEVD